jgi:hypothetical protein
MITETNFLYERLGILYTDQKFVSKKFVVYPLLSNS